MLCVNLDYVKEMNTESLMQRTYFRRNYGNS